MLRRIAVVVGASVVLAITAAPVHAGDDKGDGDVFGGGGDGGEYTDGGAEGQVLDAGSGGMVIDESANGPGAGGGPRGSGGALDPVGDWSPPPCWYAPKYTPEQLKKEREHTWSLDSTGHQFDSMERAKYVTGGIEPGTYKDFNMAKSGKGFWWDGYVPDGGEGVPGAMDCDEGPFWVDRGDPPPAQYENAVTPQILAELAYDRIRVPDTEISLKPDAENAQKVNLPTWAWLDDATFEPVSVTARVPVLGLWARTTATPVSLTIDPGTDEAELHPSSGTCPINDDGSIGTPYSPGSAEETPPCGLTYLRATPDGETYPFRATITWSIEWEGSGDTGGDLPDGSFGATTELEVDEIQSIVR
ncbi:hypothetical protein O7599_26400 [Streptomyces sp. WMMC500]|uniref:hypothetical protein n=1 Tax=Streptomyces sp. WMMC500 TaxID=3015154 RepID=UPI00248B629C|nr:hypothetical protein [Streptomyces sp. WMMC500]WBB59106.1 hypothetical protein O7599_26400 [Streptomyces sp. WMMC500]